MAPRQIPTFPVLTRATHWLTAVVLVVMIGSGLQIFNAHPVLYAGDVLDPARRLLGLPDFPASVTIGGWLAGGRRVHFAAAWLLILNGLLYLGHTLASGRWKAVWPLGEDWRRLGPTLRDHLRFPPKLDTPDGAYNPLQRMAYAFVAIALVPFLVATGFALSPAWDAIFPFWTDLFGGRQSARAWHFAGMVALIGFTIGHVALVAFSGPRTFLRMVTGRPLPVKEAPDA